MSPRSLPGPGRYRRLEHPVLVMSDDFGLGGFEHICSLTDLSREERLGEERSLWEANHPRSPVDPSLPKSHCAKCGFAIDVTRVGSTVAYFEPRTTELHRCKIKPRLSFGRVSPKPGTTLKIGGRRVDA